MPGFIAWGDAAAARQDSPISAYSASSLFTVGPARRGRGDDRRGIGDEGLPRASAV